MVKGAECEDWRAKVGEVGVEEGGPRGEGGHGEVPEGRNGCACWIVVCVVGLLDVGCWFLTVGRWPLVARVGGICFGGFFGLGFDWVVEWLDSWPGDGGLLVLKGRMGVIGMYPAGCEVGGVARS